MAHLARRHEPALHPAYERHRPEETVLYRTLAAHWPELCDRADEAGALPSFVRRDLAARAYDAMIGGAAGGVAALMFAFDDAHSMTVSWIANRYALLCGVSPR